MQYKCVDDYYTPEGKPIKCPHCDSTNTFRSEAPFSTSKYRYVLCTKCDLYIGEYLNEVITNKCNKVYRISYRARFIHRNPQNNLLNAVREVINV